jgi:hypothetical protein
MHTVTSGGNGFVRVTEIPTVTSPVEKFVAYNN